MACNISLRTGLLSSSATGGVWTYNGFIPMTDDMNTGDCSSTFPTLYDGNPNNIVQFTGPNSVNPPADLPSGLPTAGDTVSGGDNPTITVDDSTAGFYSLTYTVTIGSCESDLNLVLPVFPSPQVGSNCTITACSQDNSALNLYSLWDSFAGCGDRPVQCLAENNGWTAGNGLIVVGAYSNNGTITDITDDTFNPYNLASGNYSFIFTHVTPLPNPWTTSCPNCISSSTLTVSVQTSPSAGTSANIAVCN